MSGLTEEDKKKLGQIAEMNGHKFNPEECINEDECAKMQELFREGLNPTEIAEEVGFERGTVTAHLRGDCRHFTDSIEIIFKKSTSKFKECPFCDTDYYLWDALADHIKENHKEE
jgi:hypothetical protein